MSPAAIELKNVHYAVTSDQEELTILKGCELSVQPQSSLAIVGRSGSGKSTLLSLMAGLDSPTEGEVVLLGENLTALTENQRAQLRARQVGFVFQDFQLMSGLSALENVLMPLELFGFSDSEARARAALAAVGLGHRVQHRPSELSGGEQQRVAIARAFVTEPKILFADEPTGNLDEITANDIQKHLFELNQQFKTTLILVTHDAQLAQTCERTVLLQHGRLESQT